MTDQRGFPDGFFHRRDDQDDARFYGADRFVQHLDDGAINAVGQVYAELGVQGRVLDLCSSWVSHLQERPDHLTVLGMNRNELAANPMADQIVVHDLNARPELPLEDDSVDAAVCTASIDYLIRPVEVLADVARVLRPGGLWCCTFSNRLFATKAVAGWPAATEDQRPQVAAAYIDATGAFEPAQSRACKTAARDPLWAVWASVL